QGRVESEPRAEKVSFAQPLPRDAAVEEVSGAFGDVDAIALLRELACGGKLSQQPISGQERFGWREPGGRAIAAPGPLGWVVAELRANGIQGDVAAQLEEIALPFHQDRAVASLEDVSAAVVSIVEALRVPTVQLTHARRE